MLVWEKTDLLAYPRQNHKKVTLHTKPPDCPRVYQAGGKKNAPPRETPHPKVFDGYALGVGRARTCGPSEPSPPRREREYASSCRGCDHDHDRDRAGHVPPSSWCWVWRPMAGRLCPAELHSPPKREDASCRGCERGCAHGRWHVPPSWCWVWQPMEGRLCPAGRRVPPPGEGMGSAESRLQGFACGSGFRG